jgi:NTE family protein
MIEMPAADRTLKRRPERSRDRPAIALALAGGGPLGAMYEVGAIAALADALPTLDFTRLHS